MTWPGSDTGDNFEETASLGRPFESWTVQTRDNIGEENTVKFRRRLAYQVREAQLKGNGDAMPCYDPICDEFMGRDISLFECYAPASARAMIREMVSTDPDCAVLAPTPQIVDL